MFDIDGTLLDTHGFGREAFIRGLARLTGERDELAYLSFAGNTDRNVLEQVMKRRKLRLTEADIRRVFALVAEELRGLLQANPAREVAGAGAFLARLEAQGYALGLVTGNIRAGAFLKLASLGFDRYFTFGGFGDDHADRAQIARQALAAAGAAGWNPAEGGICLIGDTPFDVAAGRTLGIPVIGMAAGKYDRESLLESGATITITDYCDIEVLLEKLGDLIK